MYCNKVDLTTTKSAVLRSNLCDLLIPVGTGHGLQYVRAAPAQHLSDAARKFPSPDAPGDPRPSAARRAPAPGSAPPAWSAASRWTPAAR